MKFTGAVLFVQKEGVSQEDMVTSSCQEPRSRSISVQTSPRLMKTANKNVVGFRDPTVKPSKDVIDKVCRKLLQYLVCSVWGLSHESVTNRMGL
jgi:hypothetical protein